MKKQLVFAAILSLFISNFALAQSEDDQYQEPTTGEEAPAPSIESAPPGPRAQKAAGRPSSTAATGVVAVEDSFKPGWNSNKLDHGVGLSSSFLAGGSTFIYDTGLTKKTSWSYYFGYNKTADSHTSTDTTTATGVGTVSTATTNTYSGAKQPKILSMGASWNRRIFKNNFMQARWGIFGGIDYYTEVDYQSGSKTSTVSSATPTTVAYSETNYGTTSVKRDPSLKLGPMFDSYLFLRWFPNIAVGFQGGIFYTHNMKTTTTTRTTTQAYSIISGVPQTPTSYSSSESVSNLETGGAGSTLASNGSVFSFTGNFVLRYVF